MIVFVFGNPDLESDSLPLRLLPRLQSRFPNITFETKDPNEEWAVPEDMIILDTVSSIDTVRVFSDLDVFSRAPHLSLHDFDALTNMLYLQKLGKIRKINIIGIPPTISEEGAFRGVSALLASQFSENAQHSSYTGHRPG